jgi:putative component of toxin-antitoxin plasmid stabilization module
MGDVVQFETSVTVFRLQELVGANGRGVITNWLLKDPGARARFRVRVKDLRRIPRNDWTKKQFRALGKGISEIKWEWGKKQWRAIGFDYKGYFVMVLGCTHKDNVYDPADWLKTSKQRKSDIESGLWRVIDYEP